MAVEFGSVAVAGIGMVSILGYILGNEVLYTWSPTPMAINTAIAIAVNGCGIFALANVAQFLLGRTMPDIPPTATEALRLHNARVAAVDVIALVCVVGSFILIGIGRTEPVLAILITVVAYYFGRIGGAIVKQNGKDEKK